MGNDAEFDMRAPSPLQMIVMNAQSETIDKDGVLDMVVRQLVRKKWTEYGRPTVLLHCVIYLFYLLFLSLALHLGAQQKNPMVYVTNVINATNATNATSSNNATNVVRGVCEVISMLM